jgi:DNA-binding CsgD family transcriptional regulator/tetratricopeptide (TPR) repeat protein
MKNQGKQRREEAVRSALAAAAVLGESVDLPMLGAMGVATDALEALFDFGFLTAVTPSMARLSDKVDRTAVLAPLAWSERRRLHERAAGLLAARPDRMAAAAEHYLAACLYAEARSLMVREADNACAEKRYDRALDIIDRALAIWPADEDREKRLQVLGELVRCARNCGRHDHAKRALLEILEMAHGDARTTMETHQQMADLALLDENFAVARAHLDVAATAAEMTGSPETAARAWFSLTMFLADQARPRDALIALHRARELAGEHADPALLSELLGYEGLLCAMTGKAEAARELGEQSLAVAMEHNLARQAAIAYRRMANICEYGSDYAGQREAHLQAIAICRRNGESDTENSCLMCLSYVLFRTGEWKRAQDMARGVVREPDAHPGLKSAAEGVLAMIAAFRGEQRGTLERLDETGRVLRRYGVLLLEFHLLWASAFLIEMNGDRAAAASAYLRLLDVWDQTEDCHDVLPGAVSAAAFFGDAGESRHLARITDILHAVVAANDNPESRAARLAVLGEAAAAGGDWGAAINHLSGAREGYDHLGIPIEQALIRRRLARAFTAAGREREAAAEREAGAAIARRLGMRPLLAMPPAQKAETSNKARNSLLTSRQHDILRLLAAGLTNKEAADRLHLSPRTVEMHVAALLDRLNCRTRTEAIRRAGELRLLD